MTPRVQKVTPARPSGLWIGVRSWSRDARRVVVVASSTVVRPRRTEQFSCCPSTPLLWEDEFQPEVKDPRAYPLAEVPVHQGYAEVDQTTRKWWNKVSEEREQLCEEARGEFDLGNWIWGASLRHQWSEAQRMDKELATKFQKVWKPPHDERVSEDGLLEKLVEPENVF